MFTVRGEDGMVFVSAEIPPVHVADEKSLLAFCRTPRTREEIPEHIGLASGQYAFRRYLAPLLQAGAIRMTKPEAPRRRDQRYVTAE